MRALIFVLLCACGDDGAGPSADAPPGGGSDAELAGFLGRTPHFLIGMGNDLAGESEGYDHDLDDIYALGPTLDLHYAYLVGLAGRGGWPDWNADGSYVNLLTDSAQRHGVTPMFTLYAMAASGEANLAVLTDDAYMGPYWQGVRLLFERLALFDGPALVHLEPDFWAFAQQSNGDPAQIPVHVLDDACADLPDDLTGLGRCTLRLARTLAPKIAVGFHASRWAGSPADTAAFLLALGAGESDVVVIETLDRDAGCFEVGDDPNCTRTDGPWYWDESNATSPNFAEHLAWARAIHDATGKPLLWWQMPFGVPSGTPGGTIGHYRDNRVKYLFDHPDEFVAAGGVGACFGTGAGNQTYVTSDGGQFQARVTTYFQAPVPLP